MGEKFPGRRRKGYEEIRKESHRFFLAAVFAAAAVVPAFAADKTAVGKIYLTIDGTVGLRMTLRTSQ